MGRYVNARASGGTSSGGGGSTTLLATREFYDNLAATKIGLSGKSLLSELWLPALTNPSAGSALFNSSPGSSSMQTQFFKIQTALAAGSRLGFGLGASGGFGSVSQWIIPGNRWFVAARMKFTDPIVAATNCGFIMSSTTSTPVVDLFMGCYGAASTTKYALHGSSGTDMVSTVSIDTNPHDFMAYFDGNNTYLSVDSETPVAGNVAPAIAGSLGVIAWDTAGAAVRSTWTSYLYLAAAAP